MTDKERILICLVNRIFKKALYDRAAIQNWRDEQPGLSDDDRRLIPGDLVTAMTTITPNEFLVGFVQEVHADYVLIREIGSKQTCRYYNERFSRINKELLGYEILEGTQYQIYRKVKKAFSKSSNSYGIRFGSIDFSGKTCIVKGRRVFSDEIVYTVQFPYSSKTSIKSIVAMLNDAEKKIDGGGAKL